MKRLLALLLCCVMLVPMATGCKDKDLNKTIELNDKRIAADIVQQFESKFTYTHAEGKVTMKEMKVASEVTEGDIARLSVIATVGNDYMDAKLTAALEYKLENSYWRLHRVGFADLTAAPISIPNRASLMNTLRSYVHATGSALGKKGTEYYNLMFDVDSVTWGLSFDKVTKTAQLWGSYTSDNLTFSGYYDLTFGENGWIVHSVTQEGQQHLLLYLQTLDMKQ